MYIATKVCIVVFCLFSGLLFAQTGSENMDLKNLYQLSNAKSRSISPENLTGEPGKGGMATLEDGSAAHAARELGQGWKVNPYVRIEPGETFTMADIAGSGIINHIWMTPTGNYRHLIFKIYWDDESDPSVEVPVGDFFCSGWGWGNEPQINSLAICINPKNGFNSYWQMPFRKKCRVTMQNIGDRQGVLYYQIDYTETDVPDDVAYFHAQFRRVNPLPYKDVYTIVDKVEGRGQYVGTYLAHGANSPGWWGEGEIKFFIDGDKQFPTICGTGEEDYFCGSYGYEMREEDGKETYTDFSTPYTGFNHIKDAANRTEQRRFGQYRWHIVDPVRFEKDLRVTIQSIGWQSGGRYLPLKDDLASVAYWYQTEPHNSFPDLPAKEKLTILNADPVNHLAKDKTADLITKPSSKYNSNPSLLLDGLLGGLQCDDGLWMGYVGNDLEVIIDLGQVMSVNEIETNFLSDQNSWIFCPMSVEFSTSDDGENYNVVARIDRPINEESEVKMENFSKKITPKNARFIKVHAKNIKECPDWHKGAGGQAWIFVDEIIIN